MTDRATAVGYADDDWFDAHTGRQYRLRPLMDGEAEIWNRLYRDRRGSMPGVAVFLRAYDYKHLDGTPARRVGSSALCHPDTLAEFNLSPDRDPGDAALTPLGNYFDDCDRRYFQRRGGNQRGGGR